MKDIFDNTTIYKNKLLKKYTYTKTGGPADYLALPETIEALCDCITYAKTKNIPYLVLGNASNLIVRDQGIEGLVILTTQLKQVHVQENRIVAQAGASLKAVCARACEYALSGLEFACGIPGSIGGAVYMNAGAYDGQIDEVFYSAMVLTEQGTIETWTKEHMDFSYRHSILQERKAIVLEAEFQLTPGDPTKIQEKMDHLMELRRSKQPLEYPSCGSVFKRPEGHYTGALIQQAGLQGLKWGGAQISEKHAGFIVNIDHATGKDYEELIAHIQSVIDQKFGVHLEPEVRIIGRR